MVGELITLPLRVGVRVTRLWLRTTGEAAGLAVNLAGQVLDRSRTSTPQPTGPSQERADGGPARAPEQAPGTGPTAVRQATDRVPSREAPPADASPADASPADASPADVSPAETSPAEASAEASPDMLGDEPVHVSEEPVLVEEIAEPGAEDGAGAQIHVREPWEGYARASAQQVIARLATADPAELAAVQLYETGHRGRQTVLAAVEREMRAANGRGSPTQERNR